MVAQLQVNTAKEVAPELREALLTSPFFGLDDIIDFWILSRHLPHLDKIIGD